MGSGGSSNISNSSDHLKRLEFDIWMTGWIHQAGGRSNPYNTFAGLARIGIAILFFLQRIVAWGLGNFLTFYSSLYTLYIITHCVVMGYVLHQL